MRKACETERWIAITLLHGQRLDSTDGRSSERLTDDRQAIKRGVGVEVMKTTELSHCQDGPVGSFARFSVPSCLFLNAGASKPTPPPQRRGFGLGTPDEVRPKFRRNRVAVGEWEKKRTPTEKRVLRGRSRGWEGGDALRRLIVSIKLEEERS